MIQDKVLKNFSGRNVLVAGGTGLIGRQVVDLLCAAGAKVKIVSLDNIRINDKAEHCIGDLMDFNFCKQITRDMDFVFHLAGVKGSMEVSKTKMASHFVPTMMMNTNVLEACRINKVKKVVFTSSIGAYQEAEIFKESEYRIDTNPMDFAGWAKRMGELQVYAYKVQYNMDNFAIVRPSNVYGPGDNFDPDNAMVIPSLMSRIYNKENPLVIWGDGNAIRDFVYSGDVAEGVILALYYGTKSGFVNLGSGRGCSVRELVLTLKSFLDFDFVFDASKPSGAARKVMDISLAKELLGYNPATTLFEGLKKTWDWFFDNPGEFKQKKNYFRS